MVSMSARQAGTCGNRSFRRFDLVWKMIIAIFRELRFCWYSIPWSTVRHIEFGCFRSNQQRAIVQPGQSSITGCLTVVAA
jgi:hypothetical protein